MGLTLVYINCATGCLMPDLKVNSQSNSIKTTEDKLNANTLSFYFPSPRASIDEVSGTTRLY